MSCRAVLLVIFRHITIVSRAAASLSRFHSILFPLEDPALFASSRCRK
jgi:hypothetical protein